MLIEHEGRAPAVDLGAWVAPTAVSCGDVRVAAGARVLWNAVLVDDGGPVTLGRQAIVMEHALLRLSPDGHEEIRAIQREVDLPGIVLGLQRGARDVAEHAAARYCGLFGRHRDDRVMG